MAMKTMLGRWPTTYPNRRRIIVICVFVFVLVALRKIYAFSRQDPVLGQETATYGAGETPLDRTSTQHVSEKEEDTIKELPAQENPNQKLIFPPPKYEFLYEWERNLPQHNRSLPFPEGAIGRYVKFSNQVRALGWNNVFNDILMCAHLAYESKRAYVFQDYVWNPRYYPWQPKGWPWPQTPLNALIAGPTAGGPWEQNDTAPRSISDVWFDVVCPASERRIINTADVKPAVKGSPGDVVFEHWRRLLHDAPERCIEIVPASRDIDEFPQTFDLWLWGTVRILPMWERFRDSPTSRLLAASPLVRSAVSRNEHLFASRGHRGGPYSPFARMMAVHIRRGDFKNSCNSLANWNATYYGWNLIEALPDHFPPPPGGSPGQNTPENIDAYMKHCWPTFDVMVQKIHDARQAYIGGSVDRLLDVMYILTNEGGEWLEQLKETLGKDGWYTIVTSHDLVLDQEQIGVNMAVDMDIARQAAVFIGNGWSSFTSNIVHQRLRDQKEYISIRFW